MKGDLKHYIGTAVRAARERKGWTQDRLAEEIEKAVETISNIERGFTYTGIATLERISEALQVPIREFFPADHVRTISPERQRNELVLEGLVRSLPDSDLEIAVGQVRVLSERR